MRRDYEDIENLDVLSDDELVEIARERLAEHTDLDTGRIELGARNGRLLVRGCVGTEGDRQRVEQILTDVLGATRIGSAIVVDPLERERQPAAADEASDRARTGAQPGGATRTTDESAHLRPNVAADQFGTRDVREAIERGYSYEPPDGPVPEGTETRDED